MPAIPRASLDAARDARREVGVRIKSETLTLDHVASALGVDARRLSYLESRGQMPEVARDSLGQRVYRPGDVARYWAALDALEAKDPVADANAAGWLTREHAAMAPGVGVKALTELVEAGAITPELRHLQGVNPAHLFRREDVAGLEAARAAEQDEERLRLDGFLTCGQVAERLKVVRATVERMVQRGELVAHQEQIGPRAQQVFWGPDVEAVGAGERSPSPPPTSRLHWL